MQTLKHVLPTAALQSRPSHLQPNSGQLLHVQAEGTHPGEGERDRSDLSVHLQLGSTDSLYFRANFPQRGAVPLTGSVFSQEIPAVPVARR